MSQRRTLPGWLMSAALALAATGVQADDQDVIDYRGHIMKTMREQSAILGLIAQGKAPADDLAVHANVLAMAARSAKAAFEPQVEGGKAQPKVWSNWEDFATRMDELVASTDALAKSAKQGIQAVKPQIQALGCKGCHDVYRVSK